MTCKMHIERVGFARGVKDSSSTRYSLRPPCLPRAAASHNGSPLFWGPPHG